MPRLPYACLLSLLPILASAQTNPSLSVANGRYSLNIPYLEYGSGSSKLAYTARLSSSDLARWVLDAGTVKTTPLLTAAGNAGIFAAGTPGFRLSLPYLEFTGDAGTKAYAASLTTSDLQNFTLDSTSIKEVALQSTLAAPTAVTVGEIGKQTVGSASFASSSKWLVSWTAPGYAVDHYEIMAGEALMNTRITVTTTATSATLSGLKAATTYALVVKACGNAACTNSGQSAVVSATTPGEYWQLQGTGNTVATLTKPVADGNARLSATRFGPEAGSVANTVQFYYGPIGIAGLAVAASGTISPAIPASYLSFTSYAGSSGLVSPGSTGSGIKTVATGQGVPLSAALGGKVRLFFEANDSDGKNRIYSVDSVDGYIGRDFNSGSAVTCTSAGDYAVGGGCPVSLVIGVEGDGANANSKFTAARQNKIAWPTLTDWRWDGAAGAFMVFTVDQIPGCSTSGFNHAYAVWNGSKFVVQYAGDGCPKLFKSAQAALPMHIGDVRYKMYYGDPSITTGKTTTSNLPFLGPKKLIYADGSSQGDASTVEFEDWESISVARNVVFLWPNGEPLNDAAEGYIDDFHFLTPTGSLDLQVLYLTITNGSVAPFAATAILLNP